MICGDSGYDTSQCVDCFMKLCRFGKLTIFFTLFCHYNPSSKFSPQFYHFSEDRDRQGADLVRGIMFCIISWIVWDQPEIPIRLFFMRLTVALSPLTRTTAVSPVSAVDCLRTMTTSPSRDPRAPWNRL